MLQDAGCGKTSSCKAISHPGPTSNMDEQPQKELAFNCLERIMLDILCGLGKKER
jgi:hypothetical protein